jgi:hypothetical protein
VRFLLSIIHSAFHGTWVGGGGGGGGGGVASPFL